MPKFDSNLAQAAFDYRRVAPNDRSFLKERALRIRETAKRTAQGIVKIGQWLTEVKERVEHGQWLPWLEGEFGWAERSARNFMRVYELSKSANFADLNLDVSALYLIAAPSTPEPVQREVIERAQRGEPMSRAKALEALEGYKSRVELPSPAVARQIALATGEATAASNNTYVLPLSKKDSEALAAEMVKIRGLYDAMEKLAEADVTPQEMVKLGGKHACRQLEEFARAARHWLDEVLKEVGRNERSDAQQAN